jgi:hypothetical protein
MGAPQLATLVAPRQTDAGHAIRGETGKGIDSRAYASAPMTTDAIVAMRCAT